MSNVKCHVSCVICHVSCAMSRVASVACPVSPVICPFLLTPTDTAKNSPPTNYLVMQKRWVRKYKIKLVKKHFKTLKFIKTTTQKFQNAKIHNSKNSCKYLEVSQY